MEEQKRSLAKQIVAERIDSDGDKPLIQKVEKTRTGSKKKSFLMDLRIHSPSSLGLSGIEGIDTAPALVRLAKVKGLDVIGVTDFYSGEFVDRVLLAAKDTNLVVIPGVDLRINVGGCDDVILSCLFPETFGTIAIRAFLKALNIPASAAGNQRYIVPQTLDTILKLVDLHSGVALPSRIDKTPHRMSVVPELVEKWGFRAFDLAYPESADFFKKRWPKIKFQLFSFSSANALAQVGSRTERVKMPTCNFDGIRGLVGRQSVAAVTPDEA